MSAITLNVLPNTTQHDAGFIFSLDGGLANCADSCTYLVPTGTSVGLQVQDTPFYGFVEWSGDCAGDGGCALTLSSMSYTVNAQLIQYNRAFVTLNTYFANMGGKAGADLICAHEAADAGLGSSSWVALVSNNTIPAESPSNLTGTQSWIRTDGRPFVTASYDAGFWPGNVYYPLVLEAHAYMIDVTNGNGAIWIGNTVATPGGGDCNAWTDSTDVYTSGYGDVNWAPRGVIDLSNDDCSARHRLICLETRSTLPIKPPVMPAGGRRAFVSTTALAANAVTTMGDSTCQFEAMNAGLPNASSFRALYGTSSASAASRFNMTGATWYRTDGVKILSSAADLSLVARIPLAHLNVDANGNTHQITSLSTIPPLVWTGGEVGVATTMTSSCNDWSSNSSSLLGQKSGQFQLTTELVSYLAGCSGTAQVYCFEN
jgi:hypothetical protein